MNCLICLMELTPSNDSEEHVIPASVGGRHKERSVLCRSCNNGAGDEWDAELARQSMDEARVMVKQLARKHPALDVEAVLATAQVSKNCLKGTSKYRRISADRWRVGQL